MSDNHPYTKREQDEQWARIANALSRIEIQTTTTNGRVSKLEKHMLVVGTAIAVLIVIKFPELIALLKFV